jgi:hypothetical protein
MAVAIIVIAAVATFSGCTTIADYTLGEEFTPGHQQMLMRHRSYKDGKLVVTGDTLTDYEKNPSLCKIFQTRLFRTDEVSTKSLGKIYLGHQEDATFGNRTFGFTGQILRLNGVDDSVGFGFRPIYDSMMFIFAVDTFAGDTTKPVKYHIYALTDNMVKEGVKDTVFYANYDPRHEGVLENDAEPIFTFTFPDPDNGIYTTSKRLRLKETPATKAFIDKLMCKTTLDKNGLANDNIEAYASDSAFVHNFYGLHIEVAEQPTENSAVYAFSSSSTGLRLMGRSRNAGADADIIADTIDITYAFYNQDAAKLGNLSAQSVKYDFSGSTLADYVFDEKEENRSEVAMGYIDGCAGVYTELSFTDDFLYSLRNIHGGNEYSSVAINQAALKIYVEGAEYDYTNIKPIEMAKTLDSSIGRLGIYSDYRDLIDRTDPETEQVIYYLLPIPIADYLYMQESSGSLYYNGYINRSLACYEMNISSYIQALANAVLKLEENENGEVEFEKLEEEYHIPRTLYLAPEAYDRFTLRRSIVQGSDKQTSKATIQLDLTYTLVK